MFQSELEVAPIESLVSTERGIWFDPDRIVLEGIYSDQVTAYRARRRWIKTFETNFLLEGLHDFKVSVATNSESPGYRVKCDFLTACGRYAFWRLTHNQAPEVQYLLETAHIPSAGSLPSFDMVDEDAFDSTEPRILFGGGGVNDRPSRARRLFERAVDWLTSRLR